MVTKSEWVGNKLQVPGNPICGIAVLLSNLVLILGHIEFLKDFAFDIFSVHLCII